MKKNVYYLLIILLLFTSGCITSKQYLERGQYDMAVRESVRKLQKNKSKKNQIIVLEQAYPKANEIDNDRIVYLHTEGRPDRWEEIFNIYNSMNERQKLVETVVPLTLDGRIIRFQRVDYNMKIVEAKNKAADYFYHHAKSLMDDNNRFAYRQAYDEFAKAKTYADIYSDIDEQMTTSYNNGLAHVVLIAVNSTPFKLPNDFMISLIDFPMENLNSFWIKYYSRNSRNNNYDLYVNVTLTVADVSPNGSTKNEHTETKKIKDGWEYKLDDKGNIMKDTLGNPIKIDKYKTISCIVIETRQFKEAIVQGAINYVDPNSNQIIKSVPVSAKHTFEHYFTNANGDLDALTNETRAKLKSQPAPYPLDIDMIFAAKETLRQVILQALMDHRGFVQSKY